MLVHRDRRRFVKRCTRDSTASKSHPLTQEPQLWQYAAPSEVRLGATICRVMVACKKNEIKVVNQDRITHFFRILALWGTPLALPQ